MRCRAACTSSTLYFSVTTIQSGNCIGANSRAYSRIAARLPTLGKRNKPDLLTTEWILANFSTTLRKARVEYQQFVKDGIEGKESPWEKLSGQIVLGSETFLNKLKDILGEKEQIAEIPRIQRFAGRPLLAELFPANVISEREERNRLNHHAHIKHGYSLKEISNILNVHYTTISKVLNRDN